MALVFPQAEITGNIGGIGLSSRKHVKAATVIPGNINVDFRAFKPNVFFTTI